MKTDALLQATADAFGWSYDELYALKYELEQHTYYYGRHYKNPRETANNIISAEQFMQNVIRIRQILEILESNSSWVEQSVTSNAPTIVAFNYNYGDWAEALNQNGYTIEPPLWHGFKTGNNVQVLLQTACSLLREMLFSDFKLLLSEEFRASARNVKWILTQYYEHGRFKALFIPYAISFFEYISVSIFKSLGKPTFVFEHGIPATYLPELLSIPDYTIVWGHKVKSNYLISGVEQEKILVAGHPTYQSYTPTQLRFDLGKVLVCTWSINGAALGNEACNQNRGHLLYYLYSIQAVLKKLGVRQVRLRPHPSESAEWYERFVDTVFFLIDAAPLSESLSASSLVIGPASTVFIEAIYYGVNYLFYHPDEFNIEAFYNKEWPPYNGADLRIPVAHNAQELEQLLRHKKGIDPSCFSDYTQTPFDPGQVIDIIKGFNPIDRKGKEMIEKHDSERNMCTTNWISQQAEKQAEGWATALRTYYPEYARSWSEPEEHVWWLHNDWNLLDAVKHLDWHQLLEGRELKVLDLGCGTGWLSAFLSNFEQIAEIDALDSDRNNLEHMLPEVMRLMGGNMRKVRPILGMFSPLPVGDACYDVIVASSSVHHAQNLLELLRELQRVLKPGGLLVILNETPYSREGWIELVQQHLNSIIQNIEKGKFQEYEPSISASGVLYDPYLGDTSFNMDYIHFCITNAQFTYSPVVTPFHTRKNGKGDQAHRLTHFVCRSEGIPNDRISDSEQHIIDFVKPYTMASVERILNVVRSVDHIEKNSVAGAFVECGVWRGGCSMAATLSLLRNASTHREIYLYDTFEGMSAPTEVDVEAGTGQAASAILGQHGKSKDNHYWAFAPLEDVKNNIISSGYPQNLVHFIQGKVEDTIPGILPEKIAILRLDTDWYESTRHELTYLYPRLVSGGILILDDYGFWKGAKKAVDEFFAVVDTNLQFKWIDNTGIYFIKP